MAEQPEVRYAVRRDWYIDGRWYPYSIGPDGRKYRWNHTVPDGCATQQEALGVLERALVQFKADSERVLRYLRDLQEKEENDG